MGKECNAVETIGNRVGIEGVREE